MKHILWMHNLLPLTLDPQVQCMIIMFNMIFYKSGMYLYKQINIINMPPEYEFILFKQQIR